MSIKKQNQTSRSRLLIDALAKFTAGLILVGLLLFLPAGTFRYGVHGFLSACYLFPC